MKDELIRKLKELVDNMKEVGRFYISCKNGVATKSDVEKMKMLCNKGETLQSEIAALEKQIAEDDDIIQLQALMNDVSEWSDKTFGYNQRNPAIVYHLKKEVDELIAVFENNPRNIHRHLWFEFADCFMLLIDSAHHAGFSAKDLINATKEKLEINKTRKWGTPDKNGVIEHMTDDIITTHDLKEIDENERP